MSGNENERKNWCISLVVTVTVECIETRGAHKEKQKRNYRTFLDNFLIILLYLEDIRDPLLRKRSTFNTGEMHLLSECSWIS